MSDVLHILAANLTAADRVARRLSKSKVQLAHLFPITMEVIATLDDHVERELDGLLKQVENLQDILGGRIFRGILLAGDTEVSDLLPRDIANRMEALGVLDDATGWSALVKLRNRLVHEYPLDGGDQARLLNQAYAAIDQLLATHGRAVAFARARFNALSSLLSGEGTAP